MKYIPADKLIAEIERRIGICKRVTGDERNEEDMKRYYQGKVVALEEIRHLADSLQQEQPDNDMKSPFTGGKVVILSREEEVTFRGEKVKILRKYYRCEDTGREFTDSKLDDDMMWAVFRAYCEKKGMTSFTDIMLKQEQPEVKLNEHRIVDIIQNLFPTNQLIESESLLLDKEEAILFARHFYELGLNARKK